MCGFVGIFDLTLARATREPDIDRMVQTLVHRGPDGKGIHLEPGVALGFRRLAIIDLAGGDQPMTGCEAHGVWLVFNGEIYNYRELRATLIGLGHQFRSQSDSEVIVHAYEEWGEACPEKLRGIFAFCIWDRQKKRVFLARDRSGVKPLYLARRGSDLRVASEIKALLVEEGASRRIDLAGFMGARDPAAAWNPTPFVGISELSPAHSATFTESESSARRYWTYQPTSELSGGDPAALIVAFRERLDEIIRMQEVSDVPIGAYLSGGVDSAAVAAAMARHGLAGLRTYTTVYPAGSSEDPAYARLLANEIGLDARFIETDLAGSSAALLPRIAWLAEGRFDLGWVARFALARAAAAGNTKVVLTGQGIDEILTGYYPSFEFLARDAMVAEISRVAPEVALGSLLGDARLREALLAARHAPGGDPLALEADIVTARLRAEHDRLVRYLLRFEDRMGMGASVEVRVPMLDHELLELCAAIPHRLRPELLGKKRLLREAVRPWLPAAITDRPKYAFNSNSASLTSVVMASSDEHTRWLLSAEAADKKGYFPAEQLAPLLAGGHHQVLDQVLLLHLLDEVFVSDFDPARFTAPPTDVPRIVEISETRPLKERGDTTVSQHDVPRLGRTVRRLSLSRVADGKTGVLNDAILYVEFVEATRTPVELPPDALEVLSRLDGVLSYAQLAEGLGDALSLEDLLSASGALVELGVIEHVAAG